MKVGDKVVCVNTTPEKGGKILPLKLGEIYEILNTSACPNCGFKLIDVGSRPIGWLNCHVCGGYISKNIWWFNPNRFRPIEPIGEVIADYIEQTAFKEYQFEETVRELQKWAASGNG